MTVTQVLTYRLKETELKSFPFCFQISTFADGNQHDQILVCIIIIFMYAVFTYLSINNASLLLLGACQLTVVS